MMQDFQSGQRQFHNELFLNFLKNFNLGVVITSDTGRIEYVNRKFCKYTHFRPNEVIGQKPAIWRSNAHSRKFYQDLWEQITAGKIWTGEVRNFKRFHQTYDTRMTIIPVTSPEGRQYFAAIHQPFRDNIVNVKNWHRFCFGSDVAPWRKEKIARKAGYPIRFVNPLEGVRRDYA